MNLFCSMPSYELLVIMTTTSASPLAGLLILMLHPWHEFGGLIPAYFPPSLLAHLYRGLSYKRQS